MDNLLINVLTFFFYGLFGGLVLYWPLVSSDETGRGFQGLVAKVSMLGLLIMTGASYWAGILVPLYSYMSMGVVILGLLFCAFRSRDIKIFSLLSYRLGDGEVKSQVSDKRDIFDWMGYLVTLVGLLLWGVGVYGESVLSFSFVLTSLFLTGITIFLMAMGHYYLVVPDLTERPLVRGSYLLWGALGLKMVLSLWVMSENWGYFSEGSRLGDGFLMNWVSASMRILWGFVALGVLSIFSYKLAKMRSFQSATGVFYSMVFFVFVGELLSGYFFYKLGVAL